MFVGTARTGDPLAPEIVPSDHCVARYRERMPIRVPGLEEVVSALLGTLEDADITRWPPAWAVSDRPAPLWAIAAISRFRWPRRARRALAGGDVPAPRARPRVSPPTSFGDGRSATLLRPPRGGAVW